MKNLKFPIKKIGKYPDTPETPRDSVSNPPRPPQAARGAGIVIFASQILKKCQTGLELALTTYDPTVVDPRALAHPTGRSNHYIGLRLTD